MYLYRFGLIERRHFTHKCELCFQEFKGLRRLKAHIWDCHRLHPSFARYVAKLPLPLY